MEGVIVDGPLRDVDEARAHNYPIFAASLTARTARGRVVEKGHQRDGHSGGARSGGRGLCDRRWRCGCFCARGRYRGGALDSGSHRRGEAAMAQALAAGIAVSEVMSGAYEHMLKRDQWTDENVKRAMALDTATLSDALDRLGLIGQCYKIKPCDLGRPASGPSLHDPLRPYRRRSRYGWRYIDDVPRAP